MLAKFTREIPSAQPPAAGLPSADGPIEKRFHLRVSGEHEFVKPSGDGLGVRRNQQGDLRDDANGFGRKVWEKSLNREGSLQPQYQQGNAKSVPRIYRR